MARMAYHPDQLPPSPDAALDELDIPRELRTPAEEARLLSRYQANPALEGELRSFDALLADALTCADEDEPSPRSMEALFARVATDRASQSPQAEPLVGTEPTNPFKQAEASGERLPVDPLLEGGRHILPPARSEQTSTRGTVADAMKTVSVSSHAGASHAVSSHAGASHAGASRSASAHQSPAPSRSRGARGQVQSADSALPRPARASWLPQTMRSQVMRSQAMPWVASLAAVLVLFLVLPGRSPSPDDDPMRTRGAALHPLELDFLGIVERQDGTLKDALDGAVLTREDGLIFRFEVSGGQALALLERDARGTVRILYQNVKLQGQETLERVEIVDGQGRPLRYSPDGPAGAYTYLAILGRTPGDLAGDAAALFERSMRRGTDGNPQGSALKVEALQIRWEQVH